jgi:hypothetical protein
MNMNKSSRVVKQGIFLYDGSVPCNIRIFESSILYGYFDGEWVDPAVEGEDNTKYYYVEFGSPTDKAAVASQSFAHKSIEEAIHAAEDSAGSTLTWTNLGVG